MRVFWSEDAKRFLGRCIWFGVAVLGLAVSPAHTEVRIVFCDDFASGVVEQLPLPIGASRWTETASRGELIIRLSLQLLLFVLAPLGVVRGEIPLRSAETEDVQPAENAAPQPAGAVGRLDWRLTFRDEFEGHRLDRSKWNDRFQGRRTNDPELQYYAEDAHEVSGGQLRLKAEKQAVEGKPYTSGMIASFENFSQRYGYFEIRARCPAGRGLWSAFWLLPEVQDRSKPQWWKEHWPKEIDVLELLGHEPSRVYFSVHWLGQADKHLFNTMSWQGPDFSEDYHTFAVHWEPGECVWYVDGIERARAQEGVPDVPMFVLANLAVGGDWPGGPDQSTEFPASMDIDYIRVWQRVEQ